jgi:hypothetical protein
MIGRNFESSHLTVGQALGRKRAVPISPKPRCRGRAPTMPAWKMCLTSLRGSPQGWLREGESCQGQAVTSGMDPHPRGGGLYLPR